MKFAVALLVAVLLSGCAQANAPDPGATNAASTPAGPSTSAPAPTAAAVEKALGHGISISGELDAPAGFHGFLGNYQGKQIPVYVTPDGRHILIGQLFDMDGHDLTGLAMQKVADSGLGAAEWDMLEKSSWIVEGNPKARRVVYVFVDTRCPDCHHLWQASQDYLKRGNVQVRNILVAVISPDSLPEGAAILDAGDPSRAWQENERSFGKHVAPAANAGSAASRARIKANSALMQQMGFQGTPSIVYKDAEGRIRALQGMPQQQQVMREIFGD